MKVSLFRGDICDAPAEALCTSTNPRLSLMMGTGGAVRERGGFSILRACEALTARGPLPPGSAHPTHPGTLPAKLIIHCVASDLAHHSSPEVIRSCVKNALRCAEDAGCRTIAMPLFATGHARFKFERAMEIITEELRSAQSSVEEAFIVVPEFD